LSARRVRNLGLGAVAAALLLLQAGCFGERAFPLRRGDLLLLSDHEGVDHQPRCARAWLVGAAAQFEKLLPPGTPPPLLSDDLARGPGRPVSIAAHFGVAGRDPTRFTQNWSGVVHTAQCSGSTSAVDQPARPWPGFRDVEIPVGTGLKLFARVGWAEAAGRLCDADAVVVLPGFFGDNAVLRTRELCMALRNHGTHVLSLELRGHGQTQKRYPHHAYTFGVLETRDLLVVSAWLKSHPHVRRTGLVGFCWGGNHALMVAWAEASPDWPPTLPEGLRAALGARPTAPQFDAGIVAFSPVLRWEDFTDSLETRRTLWTDGILAPVQATVIDRMERVGCLPADGSLRRLIDFEYARSPLATLVPECYAYLRLLPYRGAVPEVKLEDARAPVLIVHGVNDPLIEVQPVAALMSCIQNPNVAALILPGGGHVGFAAFARPYYYSLLLNFFDPRRGPVACPPARRSTDATITPELETPVPPGRARAEG
jgi:alpha-beta hydrolase superfamily lysophospholipase